MQYAEQKPMDNNTTNHFQKQYKVVGSSCVQHNVFTFFINSITSIHTYKNCTF